MKAPKCRLCGHEHWNNEPHRFEDSKPAKTKPTPAVVVHSRPLVVHKPVAGGSQIDSVVVHKARSADRHSNDKERKAYRKWWMKHRRNPDKALREAVAIMKSIAATIKEMH